MNNNNNEFLNEYLNLYFNDIDLTQGNIEDIKRSIDYNSFALNRTSKRMKYIILKNLKSFLKRINTKIFLNAKKSL